MLLSQIRIVVVMIVMEEEATIVGRLVAASRRLLFIIEVWDVELVSRCSIKGLAASINP